MQQTFVTTQVAWFGLIPAIFLLSILAIYPIKRYLDISFLKAVGIWFISVVAGAAFIVYRMYQVERMRGLPYNLKEDMMIGAIFGGVMFLFLVPLAIKLYRKWIGGVLSETEKQADMDGVRAWLTVGNLICCAGISVCSGMAFPVSGWGILFLTVGAVLAYPLINLFSQSSQRSTSPPAPPVHDENSKEREKILSLMEEGKITPEESAELLNALAAPLPASSQPTPNIRNLLAIGGTLVLIGFFLPWFSVDVGQEMNKAMTEVSKMMPKNMPAPPQGNFFTQNINMKNVASGADMGGIAFGAMLLGLCVAVLPFLALNLDPSSRQTLMLIGLAGGSAILLYLLSRNFRFISYGFLLVLAGYVCEWLALFFERQEA